MSFGYGGGLIVAPDDQMWCNYDVALLGRVLSKRSIRAVTAWSVSWGLSWLMVVRSMCPSGLRELVDQFLTVPAVR